jgi:hypothetical protein
MNKLTTALVAAAFLLGAAATFADDQTPPQPVDRAKLKADREKAKADYAKLTPEEKAAYKKAKAAQRQKDLQEQQTKATSLPPTTAAEQKAINAQKGAAKEVTTPGQRQNALKDAEKAPGAGGGN